LNGAIEILIIDGVLIMPDAATYVGDFVTHEQIPSLPGSGLISFTVASVHALMAGCMRTVLPACVNEKFVGPPLTVN
jgi:hypothetical protein